MYYENLNNFVTKIINLYKQQKKLNITNLEFGIPTYCDDLSDLIKKLLYDYYKNKIITGIFHFTSKGKPISNITLLKTF